MQLIKHVMEAPPFPELAPDFPCIPTEQYIGKSWGHATKAKEHSRHQEHSVKDEDTSQFPLPYQPTTIVGIDPGVSTGIAIATLWDNTSGTRTLHYNYFSATCTEPEQVWAYIRPPVDVVIMERFNAQLISKYGLHTVRIIGGVQALCAEHEIQLVEDTPQQRKAYLRMHVPR